MPISFLDFFIFLLSSLVILHILPDQLFSAICIFYSCLFVSTSVPNPYIQAGTTKVSNTFPFSCFMSLVYFTNHSDLCLSNLHPTHDCKCKFSRNGVKCLFPFDKTNDTSFLDSLLFSIFFMKANYPSSVPLPFLNPI